MQTIEFKRKKIHHKTKMAHKIKAILVYSGSEKALHFYSRK